MSSPLDMRHAPLNQQFESNTYLAKFISSTVVSSKGFAGVPPELIGEILTKAYSEKDAGSLNVIRRTCKDWHQATDPANEKVYPIIANTIDPKFTRATIDELKTQISKIESDCEKKLADHYKNSTKNQQCLSLKCLGATGFGSVGGGAIALGFTLLILHLAFPNLIIATVAGALVCGLLCWLVSAMNHYTNIEKLSDEDAMKNQLKKLPSNHCFKTYQRIYQKPEEENAIEKKLHFWFLRESKRLYEVTDCLAKIDAM